MDFFSLVFLVCFSGLGEFTLHPTTKALQPRLVIFSNKEKSLVDFRLCTLFLLWLLLLKRVNGSETYGVITLNPKRLQKKI
jgi:hypothetical protein